MAATAQGPDADTRSRALELFVEGLGYKAIAEQLGVNRGTVYRWCQAAGEDQPKRPDEAPPLPERMPTMPTDSPSWYAFVDLLCWARARPGATDGSALVRAGNVPVQAFGQWLEDGLQDWRRGEATPAAELCQRWLQARGESLDRVYDALAHGLKSNGSIAAAAGQLLERILPDEYSGQPTVITGGRREDRVADILEAALADE